ncbi:MAG: aspartate/glutamate racemase family protein [Cellulosimicrobium funkei]
MTSRPDQDHAQPLVGVLGGVGPLATAYFLQLLVALTEAERDQDHVDAVVLNHATIPDRTDFILGRSDADPGPVLARDAERLERFGADFLVMPCNTAHYFTQQVLDAISVPFVSIIDTTVDAARARVDDLRAVGLLATAGTAASGVYQDAFARHGVEALADHLRAGEGGAAGRHRDVPRRRGAARRARGPGDRAGLHGAVRGRRRLRPPRRPALPRLDRPARPRDDPPRRAPRPRGVTPRVRRPPGRPARSSAGRAEDQPSSLVPE